MSALHRLQSHVVQLIVRLSLVLAIAAAAPLSSVALARADAPHDPTEITQALISLLEKQDQTKISPDDYQSTSLKDLIILGTPAGYRIKLRYLQFGISLVEALRVSRDPELRRRMLELVQWSRSIQVRSEAIVTLASFHDPAHKKYFKEALLDNQLAIRFAAVEALQSWNQPEAIPLLRMAMMRDYSPLLKLYSAQALMVMGQPDAEAVLWQGLDDNSWVVRAMAAMYLGNLAKPDDYPKLVEYLNKETRNDFVLTELCIAAFKLISKKGEKVSYSPAQKGWSDSDEVQYTVGKDNVIELSPLVIIPPQMHIPPSLVEASRINNILLQIIRDRLTKQLDPTQAQDPILQDLNSLETPLGVAYKTRYSELSYLVVEGLAGTSDATLKAELENLAQTASNPLVRADALISLAYSRDDAELGLCQTALNDKNPLVRFGAMEAIDVGRFKDAVPSLISIANSDDSGPLQIYAEQLMAKFGNPAGRSLLFSHLSDPDWPTRAMAFWFLGRYGGSDDYASVISRLGTEDNPFVKAEIALAALRLAPVSQ